MYHILESRREFYQGYTFKGIMMKKILRIVLYAGILVIPASVLTGGHATAAEKAYSFGIVPQQAASKLARLWSPILKRISAKSGYKVVFKTAKNIPTFEKVLAEGGYDLSYMNP